MKQIVIYLLMAQKFINLKQIYSEIVTTPLCLGKISKDWSADNMKKTGRTDYVYDFSANYDAT